MTARRFKVQMHEAKTLTWWYRRREKIDMEPPYQRRGRLWSAADKAYLVDSILNGYDIPKLYIADFTWGESGLNAARLPYAIIDGKQRLEAIFDFFDNELVLNSDFVFADDPSLKLAGLSYKDIRKNYPEVADNFETFNLNIMSVFAEDEDRINELFVRLNRSKPLTGAEIRNAMNGPAPQVIRKISQHAFFQENIRFTVQRGQDQNTAAKILLFEYEGEPQDTKKKTLDAFAGGRELKRSSVELAGRKSMENLDIMNEIFLPRDSLLASSGIIPVYYWFIRDIPEDTYHRAREFLVWFEGRRNVYREASRDANGDDLGEDAKDFVRFDNLNRSTNDVGSHTGRIEILRRHFKDWLSKYRTRKSPRLSRRV